MRKCVNCRHRIPNEAIASSKCEIDGHRIDYAECFDGWCKHWAKDKFMCGACENGEQTHISGNEAR